MVLIRTEPRALMEARLASAEISNPFYQAQSDEHLVGDQELMKAKLLTTL